MELTQYPFGDSLSAFKEPGNIVMFICVHALHHITIYMRIKIIIGLHYKILEKAVISHQKQGRNRKPNSKKER